MNIEPIVFYFFAAILLISALRVITARNPVHAALYLVLAFFTAAAIWMLLRAEFLAHGDPLAAYSPKDAHFSPRGHRWTAEALVRCLAVERP